MVWKPGTLLFRQHLNLYSNDPPATRRENRETVMLKSNHIACYRDFIQLRVKKTAQRVILLVFQPGAHQIVKLVDARLRRKKKLVIVDPLVKDFFLIVFIFNVSDDLLNQVLDRDQA